MKFVKDKYGARWEETRKEKVIKALKKIGEAIFWIIAFFVFICLLSK
jgi:hypothetical protein